MANPKASDTSAAMADQLFELWQQQLNFWMSDPHNREALAALWQPYAGLAKDWFSPQPQAKSSAPASHAAPSPATAAAATATPSTTASTAERDVALQHLAARLAMVEQRLDQLLAAHAAPRRRKTASGKKTGRKTGA